MFYFSICRQQDEVTKCVSIPTTVQYSKLSFKSLRPDFVFNIPVKKWCECGWWTVLEPLRQLSPKSTINTHFYNEVHKTFTSVMPICPLLRSSFSTVARMFSPICSWYLEGRPYSSFTCILDTCTSAFLPTPMSTNAPKWVTLFTFPITSSPTWRSFMSLVPCLNRGLSKSETK